MQQKIIIILASVAIIGAAAGGIFYFTRGDSSQVNNLPEINITGGNSAQNQSAPVVELPEVVARVNGEEIKKTDLESSEAQILANQQVNPATLTDENRKQLRLQALDALVSNALIRQATANSGAVATEEEIKAQLEMVKGQFEDTDKYQTALAAQGMTEENLLAMITIDLGIQKYLQQTLDMEAVTVTEEELKEFYDKEASVVENMPPLEEIHDQYKAFIVQQKQQQKIGEHVKELADKGQIEVLI